MSSDIEAARFMGITASAGAKQLSHSVTFGITLAILTNLVQFAYWKGTTRRGTHWQRFGPTYLLLAAVPLVMADLTRHVLQDAGYVELAMYKPDCGPVRGLHGLLCLSLVGWLFTIIFTYAGFACMIVGVAWGSNLHITVKQAWRQARRGSRGGRR